MPKFKDFTGKQFVRLTALKDVGRSADGKVLWECLCECGKYVTVRSTFLTQGRTKSCGCLRKEQLSNRASTHSMSDTVEYQAWLNIKSRVLYPQNRYFEKYSQLGMEDDWKNDFMSFYEHIGACPTNENIWSVDRIDTSRGYHYFNVRWATKEDQARNCKKPVTNTSGFCGVDFKTSKNGRFTVVRARWKGLNRDAHSKSFSVLRYGLLPAFAMACAYREKMIEQLNEQGAGYAANHGK